MAMHEEEGFITIVPGRGSPYLCRPRDWTGELLNFLENEGRAAEPRLSSERIGWYRGTVSANNAHRLLAIAQLEAAGWVGSDEQQQNQRRDGVRRDLWD
jgi:hypothetical protein